jgi:hypothetical protein
MVVRQDRLVLKLMRIAALLVGIATSLCASATQPGWCLGMEGLGPVRAGMRVEDVLALADWPGMERKSAPDSCWYLHYEGGDSDFDVMIVDGLVARVELRGKSRLRTISGAHIGSTEQELRSLYGSRLDVQPHKYDDHGHVIVLRAGSGAYGLRFETSHGKVTAIQGGPWEHLNDVEGCG